MKTQVSAKMEAPLSSYWVKFFKNAGFQTDVATRYAVIFSNNRIKPDMLPDLDKPSLKEMGITLMGDMIAIIRYAKKVVDETTCKNLLGAHESHQSATKPVAKPLVKKVISKTVTKSPAATKVKVETKKTLKPTLNSSAIKQSVTMKKKVAPVTKTSGLYADRIEVKPKATVVSLKRKFDSDDESSDERWVHNEPEKRRRSSEDDLKYKVVVSKNPPPIRSQKIVKKVVESQPKKTVFHRLGDSMVSSTTSIVEPSSSSYNPLFTVTGVGNEYKRNSSVFNRLGSKEEELANSFRNLRNGSSALSGTQGILKTRVPLQGTKVLTTKPVSKKPIGTMRADEEATRKSVSHSVRQLVKTTKNLKFTNSTDNSPVFKRRLPITGKIDLTRKMGFTGKLASESLVVPAKSRLGQSKQVTFNRTATVNHFKKQGVFSRLGV